LTTARYYTPSGRSIQAQGIDPDIVVEPARLEKVDQPRGRRESDLRGALRNEQQSAPQQQGGESANAESAEDYQLQRAFDLLRGLALYNQRTAN
jgi:carboxyl-terminal processing protease